MEIILSIMASMFVALAIFLLLAVLVEIFD